MITVLTVGALAVGVIAGAVAVLLLVRRRQAALNRRLDEAMARRVVAAWYHRPD